MTEMAGEKTEIMKGSCPKVFSNRLIFINYGFFVVFQKTVPKKTFTQMTSQLDY